MQQCMHGVDWKQSVIKWAFHGLRNCFSLSDDLLSGSYHL